MAHTYQQQSDSKESTINPYVITHLYTYPFPGNLSLSSYWSLFSLILFLCIQKLSSQQKVEQKYQQLRDINTIASLSDSHRTTRTNHRPILASKLYQKRCKLGCGNGIRRGGGVDREQLKKDRFNRMQNSLLCSLCCNI